MSWADLVTGVIWAFVGTALYVTAAVLRLVILSVCSMLRRKPPALRTSEPSLLQHIHHEASHEFSALTTLTHTKPKLIYKVRRHSHNTAFPRPMVINDPLKPLLSL